ncbi:hypothetical protein Z949_2681 [Sulfitobacter guttiformis KCTC 32187]|nr:hypothetical protein Z949_2681 [Sulfitobacter guttiformis KCTC 32187]
MLALKGYIPKLEWYRVTCEQRGVQIAVEHHSYATVAEQRIKKRSANGLSEQTGQLFDL